MCANNALFWDDPFWDDGKGRSEIVYKLRKAGAK